MLLRPARANSLARPRRKRHILTGYTVAAVAGSARRQLTAGQVRELAGLLEKELQL